MRITICKTFCFICTLLLFSNCTPDNTKPNTLSEQEQKEGWKLLFNGKNLQGWHLYNEVGHKSAWVVGNGILYCDPNSEENRIDLVSDNEYENFELKFEWQLEKEGNSGVFINVKEDTTIAQTYFSGPEYQLLEDTHMDFNLPLKKSGCLYNFTPQLNSARTKLRGEWNESRIIQKDGQIMFYLNDQQTAIMDFNSNDWKSLVLKSNFKNYPHFGKYTKGHIALQDWSRGVSFRNIKIREL
ncbi:3-keto-disaccharide hydrolase [Sphingobacterium bovistauri]|uniref:DUF1080 domain-containing protein n=1 Tax=Sphingobacterium bovistauri TaxID=2781959 RepID=A0ABS7Z8F4_9SPHI|nr:DUF1080 domain-containing protein [Sphingobacterium bovistauri]MCA5006480.1 DUF1080 domain-containing protein [Sphingobacterium bovistauri]